MRRKRYKKPYRVKRKKPFFYKSSFWFFMAGSAFFAGILWLAFFSPIFDVKAVAVAGNQKTSAEECQKIIEQAVSNKLAFLESKSIFLFNLNKASKEIKEKFPQIQNISIKRKYPGEILASIQERQPVAIFSWRDEKYYFIDETGVIYDETGRSPEFLEIKKNDESEEIKLGSAVFDQQFLVKLLRMRANIENDAGISLERALAVTDERINYITKEGWEIYVNPQKDLDWQITKLKAVISDASFVAKRSSLEYIDLRFARVYLKQRQTAPAPAEQETKEENQETNNQSPAPQNLVDPSKPLN